MLLPLSVFTSVATPQLGQGGLGFIERYSNSEKVGLDAKKSSGSRFHCFWMGKQHIYLGGKGIAGGTECSPSRGKTCCLEIAKVKRMGFKVFTFKQR